MVSGKNPKTILVTGAAGFIGSHAAEALIARGHRVIGVDNFCDFYDRSWKELNLKSIAGGNGAVAVEEIDITDGAAISSPGRQDQARTRSCISPPWPACGRRSSSPHITPASMSKARRICFRPPSTGREEICLRLQQQRLRQSRPRPLQRGRPRRRTNQPIRRHKTCRRTDLLHLLASLQAAGFLPAFLHRLWPPPAAGSGDSQIHPPDLPRQADPHFRRRINQPRLHVRRRHRRRHPGSLERCDRYRIYNLGGSSPVTLAHLIESLEKAIGKSAIIDRRPAQLGDVERTFADLARSRD